LCLFVDAGVDPVVIKSRADEMVGSVSRDEHKALVRHLSGTRQNWVFHALGLATPQRVAEAKLAEGLGSADTNALEKAKRKRKSPLAALKKKGQLLNDILQQSPLWEDGLSGDGNHPSAEALPLGAKKVTQPGLGVQYRA